MANWVTGFYDLKNRSEKTRIITRKLENDESYRCREGAVEGKRVWWVGCRRSLRGDLP